jgi:hypothetical protein
MESKHKQYRYIFLHTTMDDKEYTTVETAQRPNALGEE